jgi:hypothetical protein
MCLTDATNLIHYDSKDLKQKEALKVLKKEWKNARNLWREDRDINRALKKIDEP